MGNINPSVRDSLLKDIAQQRVDNISTRAQSTKVDPNLGNENFTSFINASRPLEVPGFTNPYATANSTPSVASGGASIDEAIRQRITQGETSEKKQIDKFGGVVGSKEYYQYKALHPYRSFLPQQIASGSLGIRFPDMETWDKTRTVDKIQYMSAETALTAGRMIYGLPKAVIHGTLSAGYQVVNPWTELVTTGKITQNKEINVPLVGPIETWQTNFDRIYEESGGGWKGYAGAVLGTWGQLVLDLSIVGSVAEAGVSSLRPKGKIIPGQKIANIKPIEEVLGSEGKIIKGNGGTSQYFPLDRSVAKDLKISPNQSYFKVTPAGESSVQVSIIERRSGAIPKAIDKTLKTKLEQGKFGPEVTRQSWIVETGNKVIESSAELKAVGGSKGVIKIPEQLQPVPKKPFKGFENAPISELEIGNLYKIGEVYGIPGSLRDSVMKAVTGKDVVGNMTKMDYIKAGQTLEKFKDSSEFLGDVVDASSFQVKVAPQHRWMQNFQNRTGIKLFDQYNKWEESYRSARIMQDSDIAYGRELHGKYSGAKYAEERRLIWNYAEGRKEFITKNTKLSPEVKADLVKIGDGLKPILDQWRSEIKERTGKDIGYIQNYQKRAQDIGGTKRFYKDELNGIPEKLPISAEYSRYGSAGSVVEDSLGLLDMSARDKARAIFVEPLLKDSADFAKTLPETARKGFTNYVQEKIDAVDAWGKKIDSFGIKLNKRFGRELVGEDFGRVFTREMLETLYSGVFGFNPAKAARNLTQSVMNYAFLGPEYFTKGLREAFFNPKARARLRERGLDVSLGVPHGYELAKEVTNVGKVRSWVKNFREKSMTWYSGADLVNRTGFDATLHNKFWGAVDLLNKEKINWKEFEQRIDTAAYGKSGQKIIRERLRNGDMDGALDFMTREGLDTTQYPYRKAASGQFTYGDKGKQLFTFTQWPLHYTYTLSNWAKTGQWEKLMRWYGASGVLVETLADAGIDVSRAIGVGPIEPRLSVALDTAQKLYGLMSSHFQDNENEIKKNIDVLIRSFLTLGIPGGSITQDVYAGIRSIKEGPRLEDGMYRWRDNLGNTLYVLPFNEVMLQMFGFNSTKAKIDRELTVELRNKNFSAYEATQKVADLWSMDTEEAYKEADYIIEKYGISAKSIINALNKKDIPILERAFEQSRTSVKNQYYEKVYGF